jgi:hypothetical protein
MKRTILAAATISLASVSLTSGAAAEQPVAQSPLSGPNSTVEARLDKLERINVTAYKAPQASEGSDPAIDAILQKADEAEHADPDAAQ